MAVSALLVMSLLAALHSAINSRAPAPTAQLPPYRFVADAPGVECPPPSDPADDGTLRRAERGEAYPTLDRRLHIERVAVFGDSIVASPGNGVRGGQFDVLMCLASQDSALRSVEMDLLAVPGQTIATQPPYSTSRGAVLTSYVGDLFRAGADVPDTALITPSINELSVSPLPTRQARVERAADGIAFVVARLRDVGVRNVIVLPTPPVARSSGSHPDIARHVAADIVELNREIVARGLRGLPVDYRLDVDGDGYGEERFYDDRLRADGTYDGAHLDVDGDELVGTEIFRALAART